MTWRWLDDGLKWLAEKHSPLHVDLLLRGGLRLSFSQREPDCVDVYSANLVAAAISRQKPLCIVLPDANPRRPALLLAWALLNHWWRNREPNAFGIRPILYCGTQSGVREQLSHVAVAGLSNSLDEVFGQLDLARGTNAALAGQPNMRAASRLPSVVTAVSPVDLPGIVSSLRPALIAVDLADSPSVRWIEDLARIAQSQKVLVLAWGTNPMSAALKELSRFSHVVKWPFSRSFSGDLEYQRNEDTELIFQPYLITQVRPVLISDPAAQEYVDAVRSAGLKLRHVQSNTRSAFSQTTLRQHWRLYRDLETLHVPFNFYEAEAANLWGVTSIERQIATCKRFRDALITSDRETVAQLEAASDDLARAAQFLAKNEPPLWTALVGLVHEEAKPGTARLVTFSGRRRKELFLLALLAKLNLTPDDLKPLRNWVVSVDQLPDYRNRSTLLGDHAPGDDLVLVPYIAGLPSAAHFARLWPVFLAEDVSLISHDFQLASVNQRVTAWVAQMSPDVSAMMKAVADLAPLPCPAEEISARPRVALSVATRVEIATKANGNADEQANRTIWAGATVEEEIRWLFESDDREDADSPEPSDSSNEEIPLDLAPWVDEAIEIRFSDGWIGRFEQTQKLNYVNRASQQCDERYVKALQVGDTTLLIPFQKRQNLYSLVISRVHKHPAIELHLALLRRWHEDLLVGFERWTLRKFGRPPHGATGRYAAESLLQELCRLGSELTSALAVQFWVQGVTLCPNDPLDIRRVAQVLGLNFVEAQYQRIAAAASRIRGLHRGLSNRLNHWLFDQSYEMSHSQDREVIDSDTGLTFGDIRNSFVVAEVLEIRPIKGPFLRSTLGTIERGRSQHEDVFAERTVQAR